MYLGLGSNIGDSRTILTGALKILEKFLSEYRASSIWRSAPLEILDQPEFLNMVVYGKWPEGPYNLLKFLNNLEKEFGRNRKSEQRKGPRTLDIDILLFGQYILKDPLLTIPHACLDNRLFALKPMLELTPNLSNPVTLDKYSDIASRLDYQDVRTYS